MTMADNGNRRGIRMWPSLETATRISDLANWALIGSLVIGVISTVLIVWMSGAKESYWDKERVRLVAETTRLSTETEKAKAAALLAGQGGGEIELSWPANDPEAIFLSAQIEETFRNANAHTGRPIWKLTFQPRVYAHMVPFAIRIIGSDPQLVNQLRASFAGAGIPFSTESVPTAINDSPGIFMSGGPMPAAMIFVGSKHPPKPP
jgi:hypothetical protein